jgi:hypothetical protein
MFTPAMVMVTFAWDDDFVHVVLGETIFTCAMLIAYSKLAKA